MTDIERLLAIEEIKRLKARYFYFFDHRDWVSWKAQVWAPDASLHVAGTPDAPITGVDNIIAWCASRCEGQTSMHYGHMPDIEIVSPDTAKGIWAMEDILHRCEDSPSPTGHTYLHGFGHYHETYVRRPEGWRIASTRLTRLHVERS